MKKEQPVFNKSYLELRPSIISKFQNLKVPKSPIVKKRKVTIEEWYFNKMEDLIKEETGLRYKRDIINYIKLLIKYFKYLEEKYGENQKEKEN